MPSRNTQREYIENTYYHIYNRGVEERVIFSDKNDYIVFLSLLKRYLSNEPYVDRLKREYPNYHNDMKLLAFCLMPNHFHLLIYQIKPDAITKLLHSVCTAYTMYFNRKYKRVGHLFQNRFKAARIINDAYLLHISRYIHLNPDNYLEWQFSSLPYYLGDKRAEWLYPDQILRLFDGESYADFLTEYESHREALKQIKASLASI